MSLKKEQKILKNFEITKENILSFDFHRFFYNNLFFKNPETF